MQQVMQDKKYSLTLWTPSACPHLLHLCAHTRPFWRRALAWCKLRQRQFGEIFPGPLSHLSVVLNTGKNTLVKKPPQSTSLVFLAVDLSDTHRMWESSGLEIFSQRKNCQMKKKCSEKLVCNFGWSSWRLPCFLFCTCMLTNRNPKCEY